MFKAGDLEGWMGRWKKDKIRDDGSIIKKELDSTLIILGIID
jgi:hypothetical protein